MNETNKSSDNPQNFGHMDSKLPKEFYTNIITCNKTLADGSVENVLTDNAALARKEVDNIRL